MHISTDPPTPRRTLLILAAGLGSRFGGFKQVAAIGGSGEIALDYALYDGWRAGFAEAVFVIRPELEPFLREHLEPRLDGRLNLRFVYQDPADLPAGFTLPAGRQKPWGTGQAIWAARHAVSGPFAAINADDFYGPDSFLALARFLSEPQPGKRPHPFAMVGFPLRKTLSPHGAVSRAVCQTDGDGYLAGIVEHTRIRLDGTVVRSLQPDGSEIVLGGGETVSMNMWGFTPDLFPALEGRFADFLRARRDDPKAEFYIPAAVGQLIEAGFCRLKVLPTSEDWFGLTFPEDRADVQAQLGRMSSRGRYPIPLWQGTAGSSRPEHRKQR